MFARKYSRFLLLVLVGLCSLSLTVRYQGDLVSVLPSVSEIADGSFCERVEFYITENFPLQEKLRQFALDIKLLSGMREQNGIFISENRLVENVPPPDNELVSANVKAIMDFAEQMNRPTYMMMIPTACAVLQNHVPKFAPLFNQVELIDNTYRQISGRITTVDVYPVLFSHQNEEIYYRTDSSLTGLGGYYAYTVLAKKLGADVRGMEQFDIQYVPQRFYGDLYERSPYKKLPPDMISLYHFSRFRRNFIMTQQTESGYKRYYTLYPQHLAELGEPTDVLFGKDAPVVHLRMPDSPYAFRQLLIFGDETVKSYLPFLSVHYGSITVVDLSLITQEQLAEIEAQDYTQILFGYSAETIMHKDEIQNLVSGNQ